MTMTPTEFEERYAAALAHQPTTADGTADVARGRRLLARRRLATGASALAVAVVAAGSAYVLNDRPATQPPPTAIGRPIDDAALLKDCHDGSAVQAGVRALFASGAPLVRSVSRVPGHTDAALSSRDGTYWAQCSVRSDPDAEFHANMQVYRSTGHQDVFESTQGGACPLKHGRPDPDCGSFYYSTIDHRPPEVAAVRFLMVDGVTRTVPTDDGYFAFSYLAPLPPGQEPDAFGMGIGGTATKRITFLDAQGRAIAAEAQDGSGSGPDHENIAGLKRLGAYPSLRSANEVGDNPAPGPSPGSGTLASPGS